MEVDYFYSYSFAGVNYGVYLIACLTKMQNAQPTKSLGMYSNGDDPLALISLRGKPGLYNVDGLKYLVSQSAHRKSDLTVLTAALDNLVASKYCRLSELDEDALSGQASLL